MSCYCEFEHFFLFFMSQNPISFFLFGVIEFWPVYPWFLIQRGLFQVLLFNIFFYILSQRVECKLALYSLQHFFASTTHIIIDFLVCPF